MLSQVQPLERWSKVQILKTRSILENSLTPFSESTCTTIGISTCILFNTHTWSIFIFLYTYVYYIRRDQFFFYTEITINIYKPPEVISSEKSSKYSLSIQVGTVGGFTYRIEFHHPRFPTSTKNECFRGPTEDQKEHVKYCRNFLVFGHCSFFFSNKKNNNNSFV